MLKIKGLLVVILCLSSSILFYCNQITESSLTEVNEKGISEISNYTINYEDTCIVAYGGHYGEYIGFLGKFSAIKWSFVVIGAYRELHAKMMFQSSYQKYYEGRYVSRVTELAYFEHDASGIFNVPWKDSWVFVLENFYEQGLNALVNFTIEIIGRVGPWMKALFSLLGIGVGLILTFGTFVIIIIKRTKKRNKLFSETNNSYIEKINHENN